MVFKCKICGGNLEIAPKQKIVKCQYCGVQQTLPKSESDKLANLYDRANHFLRNNDYDKASAIYEMILNEDSTDAEAYWSLVLCKYGIEYVQDIKTGKYIPTCNRTSTKSIFSDEDYKQALENADEEQKQIYIRQAQEINEIQKNILEISRREKPYDVFICYKEKDEKGERTIDSVLAQDIYDKLSSEGLKVFFARITLEDKLGTEYEPYIYAALNSSKVMIVVGTKKEYLNAPWVKNEWSRYLTLTKEDKDKVLIPCFKNMDAYDLPEDFAHLQAQDMSKIGFMQDLARGVDKIVGIKTDINQSENHRQEEVLTSDQKEIIYNKAVKDLKITQESKVLGVTDKIKIYKEISKELEKIGNYKDAGSISNKCCEMQKSIQSSITKKVTKIATISLIVIVVLSVLISVFYIIPKNKNDKLMQKYGSALSKLDSKDYLDSINEFSTLGNYKDSNQKIEEAKLKWRKSNARVMGNLFNAGSLEVCAVKEIGSITRNWKH